MAKDKKSFILYCDLIHEIDHLTDEEKGKLFQHLLEYVNDMNPTLEDRVLLGTWKPLQNKLKRDLKKYENYIDKQRKNGAKGGRPKKPKKPKPFLGNPAEPKKADNDNVSDNANANEFFINEELNKAFLDFINHRKQLKKPMTERAIELSVKKLEKQTEQNAIKMIENSIENGWSGLFELKGDVRKDQHDFKNFDNVEYP